MLKNRHTNNPFISWVFDLIDFYILLLLKKTMRNKKNNYWILSLCLILAGLCSCGEDDVAVTGISLNKTTLNMLKGESEILVATIAPENATNTDVSWSSSNSGVATVSETGQVTAVAPGSTTITVRSADGLFTASCSVVVSVNSTSLTLKEATLTLKKGNNHTLEYTITPDDATENTLEWSSSDTNIATVNNKGVVTAVNGGSATITVTNGRFSATCEVTVIVDVNSITLSQTSLDMEKGDTYTLTATIAPNDATDKTVTWSSTNDNVVKVDQNGKITALNGGSATIVATSSDGNVKASCDVKVTVSVKSISLNHSSLTILRGQTTTLVATVNPTDATNKDFSWSTSNEDIATVSEDGIVTAKKAGSVTITVTTKDGNKTATCIITVKQSENIDYNGYGTGKTW